MFKISKVGIIKLKLSPTISYARRCDVPNSEEIIRKLIKLEQGNKIVEGFTMIENQNREYPYSFFSEINIDNDRLWNIFKTFLFSMPDMISLIVGHKDDNSNELYYSDYQEKHKVYSKLEKYENELVQDGFLKFGVIYQTDNYLEEIFIHSAKYIQYWGMDREKFVNIMEHFSLCEIEDLEFIDSYPMVTTSLSVIDNMSISTRDLITELVKT